MATAEVIKVAAPELEKSVDLSGKLAESCFTVGWVLEALGKKDEKFKKFSEHSKVSRVSAVDISGGKGFVSKVYNISIEFEGMNESYSVILKVPGMESMADAMESIHDGELIQLDQIAQVHNIECAFYDDFAAHIQIPLAKIYKTEDFIIGKQPGALLMESLFGKTASCPVWTSANSHQIYAIAGHVAHLNKYFLCLPSEQWAGKLQSETYASIAEKGYFIPFFAQCKEMKPGAFDEAVELFSKFANSRDFFNYTLNGVIEDTGLPLSVSHGDLWANNILWKKNPDGSVSNEVAAIIDWQVFHEGCLTNDLARFFAFCVDGDVRRDHEWKVLEFFYDTLVKLMKEEGRTVDFTLEQVKITYKVNFFCQTIMSMMIPSFLFPVKEWTPEEASYKFAQREKVLLRCQLNAEDALEYFKDFSTLSYFKNFA
ncbi:hypothetical protein L596_023384 [Steinernema carpocapsae]|uniref:CHK kinase-like domain-containing protein n=1 Tax=Steinernema carpocapsae TaxID=34508 RepID=A0A4U5MDI8_STECR|nr:hypothetical protein L596_023384 [Steinernema carpocapsae]